MVGQLLGDYLIKKGLISNAQYNEVIEHQKATRVKLGFIAVSEKLLTVEQAEEVNNLQMSMDKRFGDIAIQKGYLTDAQVGHLLNLQGNPYLLFIQTLIEKNILTINDIEVQLEAFQKENQYSDEDMDALKSGDIDRILPLFLHLHMDLPFYDELICLAVRNIVRFISSDIVLGTSYVAKEYLFDTLASQKVVGQHNIFLGFAASDKNLLSIASPFAKEEFTDMNEDSFDSVCEFINCINGLFATQLSHDNIEVDMMPPLFFENQKLISDGNIIIVPITISGKKIDLIVSIDNNTEVK